MAAQDGFKRIAVNAVEEDEVVYAGIPAPERQQEAPAGADAVAAAPPAAPKGEPGPERGSQPKAASGRSPAGERTAAQELADLQPAPKPLVQRVVIGAAVALIIVAIIYWAVFMR